MDSKEIFKALSDNTRYTIIKTLIDKDKMNFCCSDLSNITNKDLSTISRQLEILKKASLITVTKQNKEKCIKIKNKKLIEKLIEISKNIK